MAANDCQKVEEIMSKKALGTAMNKLLCMSAGIIVMTLSSLIGTAVADDIAISMEVSLQTPHKNEYLLHIKLTNQHRTNVSVHNIDLPWIPPNEFVVVHAAHRLDAERSLMRRGGPPADYMDIIYNLQPGEVLEGDVKLHSMFPTFLNDVEKYGVIVKWRCKTKHLLLTCKQGEEGEFVIPKGGLR